MSMLTPDQHRILIEHYCPTFPFRCAACGSQENLRVVAMSRRLQQIAGRNGIQSEHMAKIMAEGYPPWGLVLCQHCKSVKGAGRLFINFPHLRPPNT